MLQPTSMTLALPVKDRIAAAAWYEANLGFSVLYDAPELGWCEMTTPLPGLMLGLGDREEVQHGGPVPTFDVPDIEEARRILEAANVRFDGEVIVHEGLVKLAVFFDLDGHALMLSETLT